jgi:hypothetical protein
LVIVNPSTLTLDAPGAGNGTEVLPAAQVPAVQEAVVVVE